MGFIADSLNRIQPSATLAVTSKALELQAQGKDVISLGAGEPDFDTPEHIKEAAIEALRKGRTKYTNVDGIPELKSAIAAKMKRDHGLIYKNSQISVGTGGKPMAFSPALAALQMHAVELTSDWSMSKTTSLMGMEKNKEKRV